MRTGLFKVVRGAAGASLLTGGVVLLGAFGIGLGSAGVAAATGPTPPPLEITTTSPLPGGIVTVAYSATVVATGGTKPYTWSATGLPTGLSINPATGNISGTPTTAGVSTVTVKVTGATTMSTTKTLSLTIQPRIGFTTTTLPDGTVTVAYTEALVASGGEKPYTFSATNLPEGLHITAGTGRISGTPTKAGTSTVLLKVTSRTGTFTTVTLPLKITPARLAITTSSPLPGGVVTVPYSATLAASGGTKPYTWSAMGLPAGLNINAATGMITGTPTAVGFSDVTVKVTGATTMSTTRVLQITITGSSAPTTSGYDLVGSDGGVFVFPTGQPGGFYGSLPGLGVKVNNIVGMVPTTTDQGYFLVGSDGGVFAFGTAPFLGSLPGLHVKPAQPIAGIVAANTDTGYFLVGKDGGVGFGAAQALGTAKGSASPVSAIAGTPTGGGYWIVTQNGTVYPFGNAKKPNPGTLPALGVSPVRPVIGIVHTSDTAGYWLIGSDGGVFAFGDAPFVGSLPGVGVHVTNVVGAVPTTG